MAISQSQHHAPSFNLMCVPAWAADENLDPKCKKKIHYFLHASRCILAKRGSITNSYGWGYGNVKCRRWTTTRTGNFDNAQNFQLRFCKLIYLCAFKMTTNKNLQHECGLGSAHSDPFVSILIHIVKRYPVGEKLPYMSVIFSPSILPLSKKLKKKIFLSKFSTGAVLLPCWNISHAILNMGRGWL